MITENNEGNRERQRKESMRRRETATKYTVRRENLEREGSTFSILFEQIITVNLPKLMKVIRPNT